MVLFRPRSWYITSDVYIFIFNQTQAILQNKYYIVFEYKVMRRFQKKCFESCRIL